MSAKLAQKRPMPELFDMRIRALRRDRAARAGPELFLLDRVFEDCVERIALVQPRFERAMLVGCPDPLWKDRLESFCTKVDTHDPGPLFAARACGETLVEDTWTPPAKTYDLVVAVGTLDTVNNLPLALSLLRHSMRPDSLFMAAFAGGDTLPQLRKAMRAADAEGGASVPHVHPRIEASALAHLLNQAGFVNPVVDVDRVPVSYTSFQRLIDDLRRMAATNILASRPRFMRRAARARAVEIFSSSGDNGRTLETFEFLHVAAWTATEMTAR